jgi:uridine phosphorylase
MEASALFSVGITRRVRVGAVLTAIWNVERSKAGLPDQVHTSSERAIQCAIDALKLMITEDKAQL